ncbi:MAG: hypothetical protein Q8P34_21035 [Bacteroidota bacterium]|nr:hypothetical protein [Bacteroidota bacterium]
MITTCKLDKTFGPVGSVAGIILFASGVVLVWFSSSALINILLGAFLGFTFSSTEIDFDLKKVRHSDVLFGLIKTGKWMDVKPDMKIGILKSRKTWRTYSRGNRELESPVEDHRLVLFTKAGKMRIPLKKFASAEEAGNDLADWCRRLNIQKL